MLSMSRRVSRIPLLGCGLLHAVLVAPGSAESDCGSSEQCSDGTNWTSLWYVWLILFTIFLLLLCGIAASCIKFCCKRKKRPTEAQSQNPCEVTVIGVDNDSTVHSTIHSTVTSYSSVLYPHLFPFVEMDRSALSPPAYSLYAMEMPPAYEEAIKMSAPTTEAPTTLAAQKLEDIPEHVAAEAEPDEALPSEGEIPPSYEEPGSGAMASPSHVEGNLPSRHSSPSHVEGNLPSRHSSPSHVEGNLPSRHSSPSHVEGNLPSRHSSPSHVEGNLPSCHSSPSHVEGNLPSLHSSPSHLEDNLPSPQLSGSHLGH